MQCRRNVIIPFKISSTGELIDISFALGKLMPFPGSFPSLLIKILNWRTRLIFQALFNFNNIKSIIAVQVFNLRVFLVLYC